MGEAFGTVASRTLSLASEGVGRLISPAASRATGIIGDSELSKGLEVGADAVGFTVCQIKEWRVRCVAF